MPRLDANLNELELNSFDIVLVDSQQLIKGAALEAWEGGLASDILDLERLLAGDRSLLRSLGDADMAVRCLQGYYACGRVSSFVAQNRLCVTAWQDFSYNISGFTWTVRKLTRMYRVPSVSHFLTEGFTSGECQFHMSHIYLPSQSDIILQSYSLLDKLFKKARA